MRDSTVAARVREDSIAARGIGLTGTPTVLVNNWKLKGAPSFERLDSLVKRLLPQER
jgi:protein-disulfide isomerase